MHEQVRKEVEQGANGQWEDERPMQRHAESSTSCNQMLSDDSPPSHRQNEGYHKWIYPGIPGYDRQIEEGFRDGD